MRIRYPLLTVVIAFLLLSIASIYVAAVQGAPKTIKSTGILTSSDQPQCTYDKKFDKDGDFVMCNEAQCSATYQYDCDDGNKDVFRDCTNSLWSRFVNWLSDFGKAKPNPIITGNSVKILPDIKINKNTKTSSTPDVTVPSAEDCFTIICLNKNMDEIYCPLSYDECCGKYTGCRMVRCDDEYCEQPEEEYVAEDTTEGCTAEYNDCYDRGTAIVCKGSFEQCSASFDGCTCGSTEDGSAEQPVPEINTEQAEECPTGVFVCSRQVQTMSGEIASSTVTCKESFQRCAMVYGDCHCGNSTLTDFPVKYIGSATEPGSDQGENDDNYWCTYMDKQVPCYMLPGNCTKKKNSCYREDGVKVNCEGSFTYCNNKYDGKCLCGVETVTSGFMYTDSQ